jgi:hypothetical protein
MFVQCVSHFKCSGYSPLFSGTQPNGTTCTDKEEVVKHVIVSVSNLWPLRESVFDSKFERSAGYRWSVRMKYLKHEGNWEFSTDSLAFVSKISMQYQCWMELK